MVSYIPDCISSLNKIFCKKSFKSLALTAIMVSTLGLSLNTANAQTVGPGCDPEFMKSMQQKAWMEAEREIMIAQTTIAKPDSVFALGCFGKFTNGFSIGFGNGSNYDYSGALTAYINAAFGHSYGGGHYPSAGNNSATNNQCDVMKKLWNEARKADLQEPSKLLGTLKDISSYDRGAFPEAFPGGPAGFATPLATFYNAKTAAKSVGAAFDDMELFAGVVSPVSELTDKKCAPGIPTGVFLDTGLTRPEIVCPNPGCASDGQTTPKCCPYQASGGTCSN